MLTTLHFKEIDLASKKSFRTKHYFRRFFFEVSQISTTWLSWRQPINSTIKMCLITEIG